MKEPFDERADSAFMVDLLQQETEAGLIGQIATWHLFLGTYLYNCIPLTVLGGKWGVGCVCGGVDPSVKNQLGQPGVQSQPVT